MKVDYAFFAIGAEVSAEGRLHVFGGELGGMTLPGFPSAPMTLTLVVKLLAAPNEVGQDRTVSLTCQLRGENQLLHRQELHVHPNANQLDDQADSGVVIIAQVGVQFTRPGVYEFGIEVDSEALRAVPFHVSQAELSPNPSGAARSHAETARN